MSYNQWLPNNDFQDDMQEIAGIQAAFTTVHRNIPPASDDEYGVYEESSTDDDLGSNEELVEAETALSFTVSSFMYSGHLLLISIPGLILVLMLGSNTLLAVIAFGGLIVYLSKLAGMKDLTTVSFLLTLICCHLVILYSSFPLLWKSLSNIFLILGINSFSVLFGGWIMVASQILPIKEIELLQLMEVAFVGCYPIVCSMIITWELVLLTSLTFAPYCFMIISFIILQPSLVLKSSIKPSKSPAFPAALQPTLVATIALIFIFMVPMLFTLIQASYGLTNLISPCVTVECLFLFCTSLFLSTFFNLRDFFELADIDHDYVKKTRWVAGVMSVLMISPMLSCYRFTSSLLPCALGFLASMEAVSSSLIRKQKINAKLALAVKITALCFTAFVFLPWNLKLPAISEKWLNLLMTAIVCCAVLSAICIHASKHFSKQTFGLVLCLHSLCWVMCMTVMQGHNLCPIPVVIISTTAYVYLVIRLHETSTLQKEHSLLMASFHIASTVHVLLSKNLVFKFVHFFHFSSLWMLSALILFIFVFQSSEKLSPTQVLVQSVSVIALLSLNLFPYIPSILSAHLVVCILATCCCVCKWYLFSQLPWKESVEIVFVAALLLLAFLMLFSWTAVEEWLFLVSFIACVVCLPLLSQNKTLRKFFPIFGIPVGFIIAMTVSSQSSWQPSIFIQSILSSTCCSSILAHLLWYSVSSEKTITHMSVLFSSVSVFSLVTHVLISPDHFSSSVILSAIFCIWISGGVKIWALSGQLLSMAKEGTIYQSKLTLIGNMFTLISFIILSCVPLINPLELHICLCSPVFFLLHKDNKIFREINNRNHATPILAAISIILTLAAVIRSNLWLFNSWSNVIFGVFEVAIILLILPVLWLFIVTSFKVYSLPVNSDRTIVFMAPVAFLLFFFGSSYVSYFFASWVLITSAWTVSYLTSDVK